MRGELFETRSSSKRVVGGEVYISLWSLTRVGRGYVAVGGHERVACS